MQPDFWLSRWRDGRTGFHSDAVHSDLQDFADVFLGGGPHRVLVPLCGKSQDLRWLTGQGHEVVGIELSEVAAQEVMGDAPTSQRGGFVQQVDGSLTFLRGDVFGATPELLGPFDRVWDRAALVALPPDLRQRYSRTVAALVRPGGALLQNAFTYDQTRMDGPPFSVPEAEVRAHYPGWDVEVLRVDDKLLETKFADRGLDAWVTSTYLLHKPA
jgi:thiopurine S-methyltransferase